MLNALINFFEGLGIPKAAESLAFLLEPGTIPFALWETLYAPIAATILAYVLGLPLGVLLVTGEKDGIRPLTHWLMSIINWVVNVLRSVPFLILMLVVMPLSRLVVGTAIGTEATIVPLTVAAAPFVARLVESSLREMDHGTVEAAVSMGFTPWQIVTRVMLSESLPSLITGLTTASITILSYGAMAGAVGGGGLGAMAIMRGYNRHEPVAMYVAVILLVILVQIIQSLGTRWAARVDHRIRSKNAAE